MLPDYLTSRCGVSQISGLPDLDNKIQLLTASPQASSAPPEKPQPPWPCLRPSPGQGWGNSSGLIGRVDGDSDLGSGVKPMIAELLGIRWWAESWGMGIANRSNWCNHRGSHNHCGLEGRTVMWPSLWWTYTKFVNLLPSLLPMCSGWDASITRLLSPASVPSCPTPLRFTL